MNRSRGILTALGAALAASLTGCGVGGVGGTTGTSGTTATATSAPDTAENSVLASALLSAEDVKEAFKSIPLPAPRWTEKLFLSELPTVLLCEKANEESVAALDGLQWQAATRINDDVALYIIVQESLLTGQPDEVEATFAALKDGLAACLGVPTKDPDGRTFTSEPYDITTSADAHYATRNTSGDGAVFTNILMHKGAALAHIAMVGGISTGPGGAPEPKTFPDHVIRQVVEIALEKLP